MTHTADLSILCVDDDALMAMDLTEFLEECGFSRVRLANAKNVALALLEQAPVDVAILDFDLGNGETSVDVALSVIAGGGRVIFVTGYSSLDLPAALANAEILEKPIKYAQLKALLERAGEP